MAAQLGVAADEPARGFVLRCRAVGATIASVTCPRALRLRGLRLAGRAASLLNPSPLGGRSMHVRVAVWIHRCGVALLVLAAACGSGRGSVQASWSPRPPDDKQSKRLLPTQTVAGEIEQRAAPVPTTDHSSLQTNDSATQEPAHVVKDNGSTDRSAQQPVSDRERDANRRSSGAHKKSSRHSLTDDEAGDFWQDGSY
jgi:hypothetical protein